MFSQPEPIINTLAYFEQLAGVPGYPEVPMIAFFDTGIVRRILGVKRAPSGTYLLALANSDYTVVEIDPNTIHMKAGATEIDTYDSLNQRVLLFTRPSTH